MGESGKEDMMERIRKTTILLIIFFCFFFSFNVFDYIISDIGLRMHGSELEGNPMAAWAFDNGEAWIIFGIFKIFIMPFFLFNVAKKAYEKHQGELLRTYKWVFLSLMILSFLVVLNNWAVLIL